MPSSFVGLVAIHVLRRPRGMSARIDRVLGRVAICLGELDARNDGRSGERDEARGGVAKFCVGDGFKRRGEPCCVEPLAGLDTSALVGDVGSEPAFENDDLRWPHRDGGNSSQRRNRWTV